MGNTKKKILYVITKSNWGGAQRYVFDLATSLDKNKFEVVVALGGSGERNAEGGMLKKRLEEEGIQILFVKNFLKDISFLKEIKAFFELFSIIKKVNPDVVHLNSSKAGGIGTLAARFVGVKKIIFTAHGWPFNEHRPLMIRLGMWIISWITALLSTHIVVIGGQERKDTYRMPFISRKILLIRNGIANLEFLSREEARKTLNISPDTFVIGSIGEVTWNKNYFDLVFAVSHLMKKHKFKLVVIGEGENRVEITEKIRREPDLAGLEGHAIFIGFKQDAHRYLKAFDIFALPSLKEGLPYTLLEAGLAGLPLVATNVGAITDIIPNENFGIVVKPRDSKELEKALEILLTDSQKREDLGKTVQERIRKEFSLERMIKETESLYSS